MNEEHNGYNVTKEGWKKKLRRRRSLEQEGEGIEKRKEKGEEDVEERRNSGG